MTNLIRNEITLFFVCVVLGGALAFLYDVLRSFRIFIRHRDFFVDLEDLLYGIFSAGVIFRVLFTYNQGELRAYAFLGIFLGILAYELLIGRYILRLVRKILSYFEKSRSVICKPFTIFCRWIRKGLKNIQTQVKMALKSR